MKHLILDISNNGVATVTINRPEVHGAFNDQMIAEMTVCFSDLADDDTARVIILTSEGKSFSAGADLNWMKAAAEYSHADNMADAMRLSDMFNVINNSPKPVIGLVSGAAFGGGVGLTAVCDMAVAVERAIFCLSEVRLGLSPATISPFVLAKIGEGQARRYFLTAERFSAIDAKRIGLIHETAKDMDEANNIVETWVNALLHGAPGAIAGAKAMAQDFAGQPISDDLRRDSANRIADRRTSVEGEAGIKAFLTKSTPAWSKNNGE